MISEDFVLNTSMAIGSLRELEMIAGDALGDPIEVELELDQDSVDDLIDEVESREPMIGGVLEFDRASAAQAEQTLDRVLADREVDVELDIDEAGANSIFSRIADRATSGFGGIFGAGGPLGSLLAPLSGAAAGLVTEGVLTAIEGNDELVAQLDNLQERAVGVIAGIADSTIVPLLSGVLSLVEQFPFDSVLGFFDIFGGEGEESLTLFGESAQGLGDTVGAVFDRIGQAFEVVDFEQLAETGGEAFMVFQMAAQDVLPTVGPLLEQIGVAGGLLVDGLAIGFMFLAGTVFPVLIPVIGGVIEQVGNIATIATGVIQIVVGLFQGDLTAVIEGAGTVVGGLVGAFETGFSTISGAIEAVVPIPALLSGAVTTAQGLISGAVTGIRNAFTGAFGAIQGAVDPVIGAIQRLIDIAGRIPNISLPDVGGLNIPFFGDGGITLGRNGAQLIGVSENRGDELMMNSRSSLGRQVQLLQQFDGGRVFDGILSEMERQFTASSAPVQPQIIMPQASEQPRQLILQLPDRGIDSATKLWAEQTAADINNLVDW